MALVSQFAPNSSDTNPVFSELEVLQRTRPTYKTRFVKRGDEFHLLVYVNSDQELPFVRISSDVLIQAAKAYEEGVNEH
ncbi:TPA: hypothetical protein NJ693_003631 [Vibrio parahaemolyticus]|nr:hypothetical protein [Vibrio parahaemolyticus]